MKVYVASDHGGFELKKNIITKLSKEFDIEDLGPMDFDQSDDYPPYAFSLGEKVVEDGGAENNVFGILICRSGIGMSIAANKVDGCFAALCSNSKLAEMARKHNNANVLVLDADYSHEDIDTIINTFLSTEFEGGRHERRVEQIKSYELRKSEEPLD